MCADPFIKASKLVFPAGLNIGTMTADVLVWRGLDWAKHVARRAPQGSLHKPTRPGLVGFHRGSARVSTSGRF